MVHRAIFFSLMPVRMLWGHLLHPAAFVLYDHSAIAEQAPELEPASQPEKAAVDAAPAEEVAASEQSQVTEAPEEATPAPVQEAVEPAATGQPDTAQEEAAPAQETAVPLKEPEPVVETPAQATLPPPEESVTPDAPQATQPPSAAPELQSTEAVAEATQAPDEPPQEAPVEQLMSLVDALAHRGVADSIQVYIKPADLLALAQGDRIVLLAVLAGYDGLVYASGWQRQNAVTNEWQDVQPLRCCGLSWCWTRTWPPLSGGMSQGLPG